MASMLPIARPLALALVVLCGCPSSEKEDPPACRTVTEAPSCPTAVREPVLPADTVQDLGTLQVGADATFVVTAGTSGFVIFSQEVDDSAAETVIVNLDCPLRIPNAVVPTDLRAPDGTLYYDDFAAWPTTTTGEHTYDDVTGLLGYDAGFQAVSSAFAVPNTSAALAATEPEVPPGIWSFTVNDWASRCPFGAICADGDGSGLYRVHVVTRPATPSTATLDLEVYLATDPTSVLSTAQAAATNPHVTRWKESLRHYLANGGITLGEVHFNDLPEEVKDEYAPNGEVDISRSGPCSDLNQLFTNATQQKPAVHLFLADALIASSSSGGIAVAGIDGSIPGPSGFPGTIYGGAIVGLESFGFVRRAGACDGAGGPNLEECGTDVVAYVTAHEIGHWLGLYHTTNRFGTFFDPISDTERCPCRSCAPADLRSGCAEVATSPTTLVLNGYCTEGDPCGGGRNLMSWLLDDVSTGELSTDQGRIMRRNPAVH